VLQTRRHRAEGCGAGDRLGDGGGGRRAVTELTERIVAPAVRGTVKCDGTRVIAAGADRRKRVTAGDDDRRRAVGGARVAQLSRFVRAPAVGRARSGEAAGVEIPGAEGRERHTTAHGRRLQPHGLGPVTKLPAVIGAPAICLPLGAQPAVDSPNAQRCEPHVAADLSGRVDAGERNDLRWRTGLRARADDVVWVRSPAVRNPVSREATGPAPMAHRDLCEGRRRSQDARRAAAWAYLRRTDLRIRDRAKRAFAMVTPTNELSAPSVGTGVTAAIQRQRVEREIEHGDVRRRAGAAGGRPNGDGAWRDTRDRGAGDSDGIDLREGWILARPLQRIRVAAHERYCRQPRYHSANGDRRRRQADRYAVVRAARCRAVSSAAAREHANDERAASDMRGQYGNSLSE